mmetsp:Transcript_41335/g.108602  ORF Transcript_41335/g.108602 Transcript_41335/m.108602 type:complete len:318 (-) Transcript_41335:139-1092(-)
MLACSSTTAADGSSSSSDASLMPPARRLTASSWACNCSFWSRSLQSSSESSENQDKAELKWAADTELWGDHGAEEESMEAEALPNLDGSIPCGKTPSRTPAERMRWDDRGLPAQDAIEAWGAAGQLATELKDRGSHDAAEAEDCPPAEANMPGCTAIPGAELRPDSEADAWLSSTPPPALAVSGAELRSCSRFRSLARNCITLSCRRLRSASRRSRAATCAAPTWCCDTVTVAAGCATLGGVRANSDLSCARASLLAPAFVCVSSICRSSLLAAAAANPRAWRALGNSSVSSATCWSASCFASLASAALLAHRRRRS